jgi:hypothetical protein
VNPRDYVQLVAEMRAAQKGFANTRDTEEMRRKLSLEKRVDQETAKLLEPQRELEFGGDQ